MRPDDLQQFLAQTMAARERAEAELLELIAARDTCEAHLRSAERTDAFKAVTGASAFDNAVASARRVIGALDRTIEQVRGELARDRAAAPAMVGTAR